MTTVMMIGYVFLGALALFFLWRLLKRWRWNWAYQRAQRHPAIISAVLWWTNELRQSHAVTGPTLQKARAATAFRCALMQLIATAYASDADALNSDIGSGSGCSRLLAEAAAEAGINVSHCFPQTLRMRIRDYHVSVSRSDGVIWEPVWRKS